MGVGRCGGGDDVGFNAIVGNRFVHGVFVADDENEKT